MKKSLKETGTPIGIEIYPDGDGLKAKQVTDRYRSSVTRNKLNDLQKVKAVEDLPPLKAKTTKAVYKYLKSKGKAQDVAKAFNMNPRPDITFKSSGDVVITPDESKPSYTIPGSVIDKFVESETTSKVVLHFDLEDGTHKALNFDSELDALNYLDSDDFPVGEWTGDYKIVPAKPEKSEYSVLSATEAKKLEALVKGISKGNEDSWYKWTQLASEIGIKHLGKSLARYGSGRFEAFCEIIDNLETFQYYKTSNLDKMLARRLPDKENLKERVMTAEEAGFSVGDGYYKNRYGWVIIIEDIDGSYVHVCEYLDTKPEDVTRMQVSIPRLYDHLMNNHFTKFTVRPENKAMREANSKIKA